MSAAEAWPLAGLWLLLAAALGALANLFAQAVLVRRLGPTRLLRAVALAFPVGLAVALAAGWLVLRRGQFTPIDGLGLLVAVGAIYTNAAFLAFAIVNLGETSLRIRMIRTLLANPQGVDRDALAAEYDDRSLVAVRLERLRTQGQARVDDDTFYSRVSIMFVGAAIIRIAKRVVYGAR